MKGKKRKRETDNQEGSEEYKIIFDLHEKEKEQQSQQYVNQLEELREEHRKKIVVDKEIKELNAEKAIYREKIRLEREKTKMTEELNTENQQQDFTVADICE